MRAGFTATLEIVPYPRASCSWETERDRERSIYIFVFTTQGVCNFTHCDMAVLTNLPN